MDKTQKMLNISIPVSFSDVPEGSVGESSFTVDEVERIKARLVWEAAQEGIEYWTGKYHVDGKKIYGKKIYIASLPNNAIKDYQHEVTNMGERVSCSGISSGLDDVGLVRSLPLPYVHNNTFAGMIALDVSLTAIRIRTISNLSAKSAIITIEYTCTDR